MLSRKEVTLTFIKCWQFVHMKGLCLSTSKDQNGNRAQKNVGVLCPVYCCNGMSCHRKSRYNVCESKFFYYITIVCICLTQRKGWRVLLLMKSSIIEHARFPGYLHWDPDYVVFTAYPFPAFLTELLSKVSYGLYLQHNESLFNGGLSVWKVLWFSAWTATMPESIRHTGWFGPSTLI